jgi:nucleotide-binding universal stress UspA family protein
MKVLVGFDGSPPARRALERAVQMFAPCHPEVVLLRALPPPMTVSDLAEHAFREALREAEAETAAAVEEAVGGSVATRVRIVEGEPRHVLERVVEEEVPDVVVVGARGQGALARALLGSVSTYAVHHLRVPVLVVR